jgi:signal transduction histidine kinase
MTRSISRLPVGTENDVAAAGEPTAAEPLPAFELLLAELSAKFINLPATAVDDAIVDALRRIITLLDVDRGQLLHVSASQVRVTHAWAVEGVPKAPLRTVQDLYPWAFGQIRRGHTVVVPRVADLPPDASVDKASWQRAGVRSNLTVPMVVAGRMERALTFGCLRRERAWPSDLVMRVQLLGEVFANALDHKRAQESLDAALRFERLVSDVLDSLLTAPNADQDAVIDDALRKAAQVLGAERATLWSRVPGRAEFRKTHRWPADPQHPISATAVSIPWISAQLVDGVSVRFASENELPSDARRDLESMRHLGVRSGVIVPLAVSGDVVGALSFATMTAEREWPESLVPRIRHLGEVFAAALARSAAERREREAKAQAIHAERVGAMGAFTASLAHELTQPLSAIESNAETATRLLASPHPDVEELRAALADILEDERRAASLIQKLRQYLRKGRDERRVLDVHGAVDEATRFVRSTAVDKGIALAVDVPQGLHIAGDAVQIQQVVVNLLLNAFDAVMASARRERSVRLTGRADANDVVLEVRDSGTGMDAATLAQIFEPYFTTKTSGMGMGLAISRTIVEAHQGTLSAESTPGVGTTFRLAFPRLQRV